MSRHPPLFGSSGVIEFTSMQQRQQRVARRCGLLLHALGLSWCWAAQSRRVWRHREFPTPPHQMPGGRGQKNPRMVFPHYIAPAITHIFSLCGTYWLVCCENVSDFGESLELSFFFYTAQKWIKCCPRFINEWTFRGHRAPSDANKLFNREPLMVGDSPPHTYWCTETEKKTHYA